MILGTLPGDQSIEKGEYYANKGNRFWKIIASLAKSELPITYDRKLALLAKVKIAIWDVLGSANRPGSMDYNIINAVVNDIEGILKQNPTIKLITLNGTKAKRLFDEYHSPKPRYNYCLLPSSSGANTHLNEQAITASWRKVLLQKH